MPNPLVTILSSVEGHTHPSALTGPGVPLSDEFDEPAAGSPISPSISSTSAMSIVKTLNISNSTCAGVPFALTRLSVDATFALGVPVSIAVSRHSSATK